MGVLSSNPWTSDQHVQMSQSLAQAYGGAINSDTQEKNIVRWTPKRLVHLSAAMAGLLQ